MQCNKISADDEKLEEIRKIIDEIDDSIADLLAKRMYYANKSKIEKLQLKRPIIDEQRQNEVIEKWRERAKKKIRRSIDSDSDRGHDLSEEMMMKIAELIIEYTVKNEMEGQQ